MRWRKHTNQITGFLVVLPSIVLVAVFVYGFIGRALWASLTDWGKDPSQALALNPVTRFIGLQNYRELFTGFIDGRFRQDMVSTVFFTVFFLAGCLLFGLLLAILIDHKPRGEALFRGVFLFPFALSFVVTGTIWRWLLQPGGGVNALPTLVGLPPASFDWLTSRRQVWRFDWNDLPVIIGLLAAATLAAVAVVARRAGRRRRAGGFALGSAAVRRLAGPAHVHHHFPRVQVRQGSRERHDSADAGGDDHRAPPAFQAPQRRPQMTASRTQGRWRWLMSPVLCLAGSFSLMPVSMMVG